MPIKVSTINTIKKELINRPKEELIQHCLRLAKYKKDNKELLHYLLFESDDETNYIEEIKEDIISEFKNIRKDNLHYAKKNIRRILRLTTKHIKHSGIKETEVDLLLCFCQQMQNCGVSFRHSKVMLNLYDRQLKNIEKALKSMHEDMIMDYEDKLDEVRKGL